MAYRNNEVQELIRFRPDEARRIVLGALTSAQGLTDGAARTLKVSRHTLVRWIHRLELEPEYKQMREERLAGRAVTQAGTDPDGVGVRLTLDGAEDASSSTPGGIKTKEGVSTTFALDEGALSLLGRLQRATGLTRSGVVKMALRELGRREGVALEGRGES